MCVIEATESSAPTAELKASRTTEFYSVYGSQKPEQHPHYPVLPFAMNNDVISISSSPVTQPSSSPPLLKRDMTPVHVDSFSPTSTSSAFSKSEYDAAIKFDTKQQRAVQIAFILKRRLSYASFKVKNGWQNETLETVLKLTDERYQKISLERKEKETSSILPTNINENTTSSGRASGMAIKRTVAEESFPVCNDSGDQRHPEYSSNSLKKTRLESSKAIAGCALGVTIKEMLIGKSLTDNSSQKSQEISSNSFKKSRLGPSEVTDGRMSEMAINRLVTEESSAVYNDNGGYGNQEYSSNPLKKTGTDSLKANSEFLNKVEKSKHVAWNGSTLLAPINLLIKNQQEKFGSPQIHQQSEKLAVAYKLHADVASATFAQRSTVPTLIDSKAAINSFVVSQSQSTPNSISLAAIQNYNQLQTSKQNSTFQSSYNQSYQFQSHPACMTSSLSSSQSRPPSYGYHATTYPPPSIPNLPSSTTSSKFQTIQNSTQNFYEHLPSPSQHSRHLSASISAQSQYTQYQQQPQQPQQYQSLENSYKKSYAGGQEVYQPQHLMPYDFKNGNSNFNSSAVGSGITLRDNRQYQQTRQDQYLMNEKPYMHNQWPSYK
ncbi:hypothetical protein HK100_004652 [Physocladia obscura]|uniref:Uncharacterized protein n=1 Tax=Physocladia obscura TaxID=109957 RepID=A0AAD5T6A3_9FUNG|nr:hypothetical protein HK100_004652 [Physocladia obscura]